MPHRIDIWTSHIRYRGEDRIDVTVKSASDARFLAPTEAIVYGHKAYRGDSRFQKWKPIDDETYRAIYRNILAKRYHANPHQFVKLLSSRKEITLLCYCTVNRFCHRHQLAEILEKIAKHHGIEVILRGERP